MKYISQNQESNKTFFVQPGDYDVTIIDATEAVSKNTGAEMIKLNLEVDGHGCRLFDYLIASETTFWKVDAFRKAIGDDVVEGEEVEIIAQSLIGRRGRVRLKTEEYNGKTNNKVELWLESESAPNNQSSIDSQEDNEHEPF